MPTPNEPIPPSTRMAFLRELAIFFLRLGTTAFGGPAIHIAMMEKELVSRRKWLSREKFLDLLGASNLIPGPSSSELAIHLGYMRAGIPGLLIAGLCFVLPAALMMGILAWAYVRFGSFPPAPAVLYGTKPVIIAVVLQAVTTLGRTAVKNALLAVVGLASLAVAFLGVHPLITLAAAGIASVLAQAIGDRLHRTPAVGLLGVNTAPFVVSTTATLATASAAVAPFSLGSLFLVFLKAGAVVFGSGYVLLAFLHTDLVAQRGWLTDSQLTDAIALGQITPGPVFTTATFIGYLTGGFWGAVIATIGIFLPAFLLVAISGPLVPRIRRSRSASAFLDGVNVGSLALIGAVVWRLGRASVVDLWTALLLIVSLAVLWRFRVNSFWLLLGGSAIGVLIHALAR